MIHAYPSTCTPATAPRRAPRRWVGLALLVGTLLVASACANTRSGSGYSGPPIRGGTLRYGLSQAPTCADPAQASTNQTLYVARQVVDSLTDQDPRTGQVIPWLARTWDVSPNATQFTFHLRPGVTFSDGTPLDAIAVGRTFDSIARTLTTAKAPLGASYLAGYAGTAVMDPLTARVSFSAPNAQFLQATATAQLGILSTSTTAQTIGARCQGAIVGTGPFVYSDYAQDRSATLSVRRGYAWGSSAFGHPGDAYLDRVEFSVVPESGVRTGSLASGQLDAISDALPQDRTIIEKSGGAVLNRSNPGVPFGIQPNVSRSVLSDPVVRSATMLAVDRPELTDTVLDPSFPPATGLLAQVTPGFVRVPDVTFDRSRAQAQLDAAGWRPGRDGIRAKNGRRLSFNLLFSAVFAANQTVLELLQQQLRAAGIDMGLELVSSPEFTARQNNGDYDALYYNSTRSDGDILRTAFSAKGRNLNHGPPVPALEQAFVGELSTADEAARMRHIADAQTEVARNGLFIPTIELSQTIGAGPSTRGLAFDASARLQFHDTWLSGD